MNMVTRIDLVKKYLVEDIRTFTPYDDNDFEKDREWSYSNIEFSMCNQRELYNEFNKVKDKTNVIVEIGVSRIEGNGRHKYEESSTSIFINNKHPHTKYLGIDINDKSYLETYSDSIFTLKSYSEDYKTVLNKFKEIGIKKIDFLFVDGWHSINQIVDELWYLNFMESGGVIGYHDTNFHPGPSRVIDRFKPELYDYKKCCTHNKDWGIGFVYIK